MDTSGAGASAGSRHRVSEPFVDVFRGVLSFDHMSPTGRSVIDVAARVALVGYSLPAVLIFAIMWRGDRERAAEGEGAAASGRVAGRNLRYRAADQRRRHREHVMGPFYLPGAPWIDNPGSIVDPSDGGEQVVLRGRVRDATAGSALNGAVVDIWQANAEGVYSNEEAHVPEWNLRGRQRTNPDGQYQITTVRPKHYTVKRHGPVGRLLAALGRHPWRPVHIHFLVSAEGYRPLVTQVYLAGGPYLDNDTISVKEDLVLPVSDAAITFDIGLNRGV